MASSGRVHVSSSIIRELSSFERKLDNFVPKEIEDEVYEHLFNHYKKSGQFTPRPLINHEVKWEDKRYDTKRHF